MFFKKKKDHSLVFQKHLDSDFQAFACGEDAPSKADIKSFEKQYDITFPEDFKEFSTSPMGGAYVDVKEEVWPRSGEYEVGPFWSFLYGLFVYSFSKESPEWMNIQVQTGEFRTNVHPDYVPVLKVIGDADLYCFDKKGIIHQWEHETGEFKKIDKTFEQLLDYELAELKSRKERKKAGE